VQPPPRDAANQAVIWAGLSDGLFTVFSSDHAPFRYDAPEGKKPGGEEVAFRHIPNGIPGLETRMPLLYSEGVLGGRITVNRFVELTATNPAKAYGLHPRKGTIAIGSDADLVIWGRARARASQRGSASRGRLHTLRRQAPARLARRDDRPRRGGLGRRISPPHRARHLPLLRRAVVAANDKARARMTRLLLINPNISDSVSELIRAEALRSVAEGTTVDVLTAPFGVAYIETRFEALIGAYAAAQLAAEHHERFDAVIVAAFGDPGLAGLREVLPIPVTGLTEAALASAHLLGHRISIIAISQRIQAWYREVVEAYGFGSRLASIRALDRPLTTIGGVQDEHAQALQALARKAVDEDGAEVIVLAGAPLAGLARSLAGRLAVPVVDGVSSAVRHAQTLVALRPGRATQGSFASPPIKPHRGLPSAIASLLERRHC
jgi:Asp/Glu/hydantoin racemase